MRHTQELRGGIQSIELERTITRADGTVEPTQTVAYWHRNPLKRLLARLSGMKGTVKPWRRSA